MAWTSTHVSREVINMAMKMPFRNSQSCAVDVQMQSNSQPLTSLLSQWRIDGLMCGSWGGGVISCEVKADYKFMGRIEWVWVVRQLEIEEKMGMGAL